MMRAYTPQPGTIPARVVEWLRGNPGQHATGVIADALDISSDGLGTTLGPSVHHGLIERIKREGRTYYSAAGAQSCNSDLMDEPEMVQRVVSAPMKPRTRWGAWSDGSVVIECGKVRIELDKADATRLAQFLNNALPL